MPVTASSQETIPSSSRVPDRRIRRAGARDDVLFLGSAGLPIVILSARRARNNSEFIGVILDPIMNLRPAIRELIEYNYWARDRQLHACAALTEEQFLRPLGGSFSSVRDTLAHLMACEWIWLERWRGRSPRALFAAAEFPTLESISARWQSVEVELREYVSGLSEEALAEPLTCITTRGEQWTHPLWRMISHLLNHQNYHRGQVTHQLRLLGAESPRVDFLLAYDMGLRPR
jgi:uncharacterized damage-inducible protein DinB